MGVRGKGRKAGHNHFMRQKSNKTNEKGFKWRESWEIRLGSFSEKQAEGLATIAIKIIPKIACGLFLFVLHRNHMRCLA